MVFDRSLVCLIVVVLVALMVLGVAVLSVYK